MSIHYTNPAEQDIGTVITPNSFGPLIEVAWDLAGAAYIEDERELKHAPTLSST